MKKLLLFITLIGLGVYTQAQNFVWAKSMGGASSDGGSSIVVDAFGNVYTTGYFAGTADFDPGAGTFNLTSAGGYDVFVSKLDASGNFVWAKSMGGGDNDYGTNIAVDLAGNVYTTGFFTGTSDFDPGAGTFNLTSAGPTLITDIFVSKLDASGNFVWAKRIGGTGWDYVYSIAVDAVGNVYTTGSFTGTSDFDPGAGIANLTSAGSHDIFVSKLDVSGNFVWAKRMGGTDRDYGRSIAVDTSGNVYTTGYFNVTADFDPGAGTFNLTPAGSADIFVSKLDASGNFVWAKNMGGTNSDYGMSIAVDAAENVYTSGYFWLTADFDPGAGTFNLTPAGSADIFISKLDASGNFVWAKRMGGTSSDGVSSIAIDSSGNIYTTGSFEGTADFDPGAGVVNLTSVGNNDIFVSKLRQCMSTGIDIQTSCDSLTWLDGITYTTSTNSPTFILTNAVGCDSVVTLNLTINSNTGIDTQTTCDSLTWIDGITYTTSTNTPTFTLTNAVGCDSVVTLNLTINSNSSTDVIAACDSITWIDGNTYATNTNTPTFTLTNIYGCDSVVTLNLTINNSNAGTDVQTACNNLTWIDNVTYTSSTNTPTFTIVGGTANGCDSVVTLNLTINTSTSSTDVIAACDSLTWIDGNTYSTNTNTPTFTLTNAVGCDSVVTLNLTINNSTSSTDIVIACDSITWIDGNTYSTNTNTPTFTLTNAAGCDSVVTLNLTINNSNSGTDIVTACDSLTWIDGNTYATNTNTPTFILTNAAGCDSVVTLNLTINNSNAGTDVQTTCNNFTWLDNVTYTSSTNTPTFTIVGGAANGCDSIVTLDLTINTTQNGTDLQTACNSFTWIDNVTYTSSTNTPTFTIVGGAANGCDSIVTLDLTITTLDNTTSLNTDTISANQNGATYQWLNCDSNNVVIVGATAQSFIPTATGNYAVELTVGTCVDTSACVNVIITGIEELTPTGIKIYPNPINDNIVIEFGDNPSPSGRLGGASVNIVNIEGKVVYSNAAVNSNKLTIDAAAWSKGVYFVTVINDITNTTLKLIKE